VVGIYGLLRVCFWVFNQGQFPDPPLSAFVGGLRFDLMALAWINLPWALLVLVSPDPGPRISRILFWTFLAVNAIGLFFNCVDIAYYAFTLKRSTADLFGIMGAGNDLANLVPLFLRDYWYIVLIYAASLLLAARCYRWADRIPKGTGTGRPWWLWRLLVIGLFGVATRGGIQLIPLGVLGASAYAEPAYMPVVLNTPFTIIKSIGRPVLEERLFMAQPEADRLWPVHHAYAERRNDTLSTRVQDQRPNVVVIILESFSAAYSARLNGGSAGYMPFLDSLMAQGLCFSQAYANGRRSIDGIPAILASMPKLSEEAFISSPYATAPFTSFASVLKSKGYATSFYHGGRNGTMGFDTFTRSAGYDRYVGRDEYPLEGDDDGSWGIRDRPFLQFFAAELARMPEPFHSVVFTLSSHHPYHLASDDAQRFAGGTMPIHPTLRYADDALRAFFGTARSMPWFSNTLFVITADHTADLERNGQLSGSAFDLWIPLVYYMPGRLTPQQVDRTTQQIDILPTTLDLIGHGKPFFSFGSSALRNDRLPSAVSEGNATWMIVTDSVQLRSDGEQVLWVGPAPGLPDPGASTVNEADRTLQAAIQQFHAHLLKRDMVVVK
jgi:phosphoglycerol transferase MdoB-like AlkP superfamily enzyme